MIADNPWYTLLKLSRTVQTVYVVGISFDDTDADVIYLTSAPDTPTPDLPNTIQNCISEPATNSQTLDFANHASTIGNISVKAVDVGGELTALLRYKNQTNKALTGRRLKIWKGHKAFTDFSLFVPRATQYIESVSKNRTTYTINAYDKQREQKSNIFEVKTTVLNAKLLAGETATVTVRSTLGFAMIPHTAAFTSQPPSVLSGMAGSPTKIGYFELVDGEKHEIIGYTGITPITFTGLIRGCFGTKVQEWNHKDGDEAESKHRELQVTEYIYWEENIIKTIYMIQTGIIYGTADFVPSHWCLGIKAADIDVSEYLAITFDLWKASGNVSVGRKCTIRGVKSVNGKSFIQKELCALGNVFIRVKPDGRLGLKKITEVLPNAPSVFTLTENHIVSIGDVKYDLKGIVNRYRIDWAYDSKKNKFGITNLFHDTGSITQHGESDYKTIQFKALQATSTTADDIRRTIDTYNSRYSNRIITLQVTLLSSLDCFEVGDIVELDVTNLDYTNTNYSEPATLNRSFEIQSVSVSKSGVQLSLLGSTAKAASLIDYMQTGPALLDAAYTKWLSGKKISSANFAAVLGTTNATLNADLTLTGADLLWLNETSGYNNQCVYWVDGNLTIPSGRTLTVEKNVFLWVKGFLQIDGTINGVGRGHIGESRQRYNVPLVVNPDSVYLDPTSANFTKLKYTAFNNGSYPAAVGGGFGAPLLAQPFIEYVYVGGSRVEVLNDGRQNNTPTWPKFGLALPRAFDLETAVTHTDNDYLSGLPQDLQGSGGPAGGVITHWSGGATDDGRVLGSSGGAGGAGLAIISRGGAFGTSGKIDLSGASPATDGGKLTNWNQFTSNLTRPTGNTRQLFAPSGSGGGMGALVWIIDGADPIPPVINANRFKAHVGAVSFATKGTPYTSSAFGEVGEGARKPSNYTEDCYPDLPVSAVNNAYDPKYILDLPAKNYADLNYWENMHAVQILPNPLSKNTSTTPIIPAAAVPWSLIYDDGGMPENGAQVNPVDLADLDSTAATKLGTIQTGAQVNPANLAALDSTAATKLGTIATGATKNQTFYQSGTPTGMLAGDFWYNTSTSVLSRYNGSSWQAAGNNYTNTNQLTDGAGLGTTSTWAGVTGANRPADNATVGATWSSNIVGRPSDAALLNVLDGLGDLNKVEFPYSNRPMNIPVEVNNNSGATRVFKIAAGKCHSTYQGFAFSGTISTGPSGGRYDKEARAKLYLVNTNPIGDIGFHAFELSGELHYNAKVWFYRYIDVGGLPNFEIWTELHSYTGIMFHGTWRITNSTDSYIDSEQSNSDTAQTLPDTTGWILKDPVYNYVEPEPYAKRGGVNLIYDSSFSLVQKNYSENTNLLVGKRPTDWEIIAGTPTFGHNGTSSYVQFDGAGTHQIATKDFFLLDDIFKFYTRIRYESTLTPAGDKLGLQLSMYDKDKLWLADFTVGYPDIALDTIDGALMQLLDSFDKDAVYGKIKLGTDDTSSGGNAKVHQLVVSTQKPAAYRIQTQSWARTPSGTVPMQISGTEPPTGARISSRTIAMAGGSSGFCKVDFNMQFLIASVAESLFFTVGYQINGGTEVYLDEAFLLARGNITAYICYNEVNKPIDFSFTGFIPWTWIAADITVHIYVESTLASGRATRLGGGFSIEDVQN